MKAHLLLIVTCIVLGFISAVVVSGYAFTFHPPVAMMTLWLGCSLFFLLFYFLRIGELNQWLELCLIVVCGALAGFLTELFLTGLVGTKGLAFGTLLGVGLALEGLIMLAGSKAIDSQGKDR